MGIIKAALDAAKGGLAATPTGKAVAEKVRRFQAYTGEY